MRSSCQPLALRPHLPHRRPPSGDVAQHGGAAGPAGCDGQRALRARGAKRESAAGAALLTGTAAVHPPRPPAPPLPSAAGGFGAPSPHCQGLGIPPVPPWLGPPLRGPLRPRAPIPCLMEDATGILHVNIKRASSFAGGTTHTPGSGSSNGSAAPLPPGRVEGTAGEHGPDAPFRTVPAAARPAPLPGAAPGRCRGALRPARRRRGGGGGGGSSGSSHGGAAGAGAGLG